MKTKRMFLTVVMIVAIAVIIVGGLMGAFCLPLGHGATELPEDAILSPTESVVSEVKETDVNGNHTAMEQGGMLTEPPALTVVCNEKQISALRGTYSWEHQNQDGTSICVEADSMHPLDSKAYMPAMPLAYSAYSVISSFAVYFQFPLTPDEVEVIYWSADCWGETTAKEAVLPVRTIETELADGSWGVYYMTDLLPGNYIYEIAAKWSSAAECSGEARYSFCTTMGDYQLSGAATVQPALN